MHNGSLFAGNGSIECDVQLYMLGQGAQAALHGTYIGTADQTMTLYTRQYHVSSGGTSNVILKGIASDSSSISYEGLIHIAPLASATDASLENGTLVFSLLAR